MTINLTTPFNPGDLDNRFLNGYEEVKIIKFRIYIEEEKLHFYTQLGNTVEGKWEKGIAPIREFVVVDESVNDAADPQNPILYFTNLVSQVPLEGETTYQAAARALYQWLLANNKYEGTL